MERNLQTLEKQGSGDIASRNYSLNNQAIEEEKEEEPRFDFAPDKSSLWII